LRAASTRDLRASYAMTLVAIRHHKPRDAAQFLEEALAAKPNNLHLRKARLWLLVSNKDYSKALDEMTAMAKDLAGDGKGDPLEKTILDEQAQMLGVLLAYIQGPSESALTDKDVSAVEKQILKNLPEDAHEAFRAGKTSVEELSRTIAAELQEARVKAKLEVDAKRAVDLAKLEKICVDCKAQAETVQPRFVRRAMQLTAQLAEYKRENTITFDTDKKTGQMINRKGSHDSKIRSTQNEIANLPDQAAAELAQLDERHSRAAKQIGQLERQIKQAAENDTAESGQTTVVRKRMASLATYCEFPLEEERQKLLASFSKK
jgi:hypothetical protein